jgi:hypothetical protein
MATETIYALFQSVSDAERAIGALEDHGIPSGQIGVITRQPAQEVDSETVSTSYHRVTDDRGTSIGQPMAQYAPTFGSTVPGIVPGTSTPATPQDTADNVEEVGKHGITTTTASDAGAGAGVGAGIGLVAGLLAAAASLTIPGVGIVLAGGAVAGAIAAAAATTAAGAMVGGVAGYLNDMGMPEQAATRFEDRVLEGDYLISVMMDTSQYDEVKSLLLKYNAAGVDFDPVQAGGTWRPWGNEGSRTYFDAAGRSQGMTDATPPRISSGPLTPNVSPEDFEDDLDVADESEPVDSRRF